MSQSTKNIHRNAGNRCGWNLQHTEIASSFFPDEHTHVEPVRYGKGSNFMGLLQTIMTDGSSAKARRRQWLRIIIRKPMLLPQVLNVRRWSERTVIALVMQNVDSAISVGVNRLFPTVRQQNYAPCPPYPMRHQRSNGNKSLFIKVVIAIAPSR